MNANIRLRMDSSQKIILKRHLNKNGRGALYFASELKRVSDPYVPFLNGPLKNTAQPSPGKLEYVQPYARRWWYTHKGKGLRGRQWCIRAWASRGNEVVRNVARFCGGRAE